MSLPFDTTNHSHQRFNPLCDGHILCSPHRAKRPWQGAQEEVNKSDLINYDPTCYLCPSNIRATGDVNPKYDSTYIFPNDYPAVRLDQPEYEQKETDPIRKRLLKIEGVRGKCFVICFSPNHGLTLPLMDKPAITKVVDTWQKLYLDLKEDAVKGAPYKYLQIFENKGSAMGCSNPHPHGQAWCLDVIPTEVSNEIKNLSKYRTENEGHHMLGDYVKVEIEAKERIVVENDSFIVVVPFWALWPFETLLIAKEHLRSLEDFSEKHKSDLADVLQRLTIKYDNLFLTSFPYSAGIHQAPLVGTDDEKDSSWFHMHFYPPLLRSALIKKFCVGFEMLGEPQRDLTSEQAAARLQELPDVHYSKK